MSNPIKEFLEMKKTAAPVSGGAMRQYANAAGDILERAPNWWERTPELVRRGAVAVGAFAAATAANEAYGAIKDAIGKARGFKALMAHNPTLAKQDRTKVQKLFNTLHTVSPDLAQDPLVANSWINRMMYQEEYIDPKTLSDLAKAQGDMAKGRQIMSPDFAATMMYMGGTDKTPVYPEDLFRGTGPTRK